MRDVDLRVYPDQCDALAHLNQAASLALFERARWEMLARGPGMDLFRRAGTWPVIRKTTIEYHAPALAGDVLRFSQTLLHHGRTSFTMRQTARRLGDDVLIASAEFVMVCIDESGRPTPVPEELGRFMEAAGVPSGEPRRLTVNGVRLAVELAGEGPPLLYVHGFPLDRTIWRHQLAGLAHWRGIAPDLRGLGQSAAPDLGYSMATYAADLAALMDTLGVTQAVLCGLSMGGYVVFEFLRRYRERVRGLVLVSTRAEADTPDGRRARDANATLVRERGAPALADQMLPQLLAPTTLQNRPEIVADLRRLMAAAPVPGIAGALAAMRDRPDSRPLLSSLGSMPTLVVAGEEDRLIGLASARAMAGAIPHAKLRTIPGAGHVCTLEQPGAVTGALLEFLASLG